MKLLCLNLWGGTQYQVLFDYLRTEAEAVDIFCFQEVFSALHDAPEVSSEARMYLFEELKYHLNDFVGLFDLRSTGYDFNGPVDFSVSHGLAMFVKRDSNVKILSTNSKLLFHVEDSLDKSIKAQILELKIKNRTLGIINFHGVALPGDKLDTPERLEQSEKLVKILESIETDGKILCGDFNLMPGTRSVKILEDSARNLIKEFNITNTRNKISWGRFDNKQMFADYTFISPDLKVKSFDVPYNEVSDHLPMILEFSI